MIAKVSGAAPGCRTGGFMSGNLRLARLYFLLLGIFAAGRWLQGTAGVPYEDAHQVFSIVILTLMSAFYYGAFCRVWLGCPVSRALGLGLTLGVASQLVILVATLASYTLGLETYFNAPGALRVEAAVPVERALVIRLGGLVVNSLLASLAGALGWVLGTMLPQAQPRPGADDE